ncbi:MAG: acyltransferase family protein [Bacteroidales bacterium]|nr:acyltransferase family protein [Bacteroidales bacterium]
MNRERQMYVDWIRIFLIFSVFIFHVGMVFNEWYFPVKNEVQLSGLAPVMSFLHIWRMPLLFLVSGAGTRFALGFRNISEFVRERSLRLMLPFLFGLFLLVPVQVYLEKADQYPSLFNFYTHMFEGFFPEGNFSWHHLWYLLYLYLIVMLFIPFIAFFRSKGYSVFEGIIEKITQLRGGMILFVIPVLASQIWLRPYFPEETHALADDWAYFCLYLLYFVAGFIFLGNANIVKHIVRDRCIWLSLTVITLVMMQIPFLKERTGIEWLTWTHLSIVMGWAMSLTVLGYFKQYFNKDHLLRKPLNRAIYPFYLIHQPVLVVMAYLIIPTGYSIAVKALLIIGSCLMIIWFIYQFIIKPFAFTRIIFGLKKQAIPQEEISVIQYFTGYFQKWSQKITRVF